MITDPNQLAAALSEPIATDEHRSDWNKYIDFLGKRGLAGSTDLDKNGLGKNMLARFIKENPSTSLTPDSVFHAQNDMSNQTEENSIVDGLHSNATKTKFPVGNPTAKIPQDELAQFGNWTGQNDPKLKAEDLKRRGLEGAQQLIEDQPNLADPNSIRNSQSDWKTAAVEQILSNALKSGFRTPEAVNANKDVLIGNKDWANAINSSDFNVIHPNFWQIINHSLLPEQWAKYDAQKTIAKR